MALDGQSGVIPELETQLCGYTGYATDRLIPFDLPHATP